MLSHLVKAHKMNSKYGIVDIKKFTMQCYYVSIIAGVVLFCGIISVDLYHVDILHILPPCVMYTQTGLYCPGCGGTRAVNALLQGHLWTSLLYHPFVLYTVLIYIVFTVKNTLFLFTKGKIKMMIFRPGYFYLAIIIVLIQWIVKDIILICNI